MERISLPPLAFQHHPTGPLYMGETITKLTDQQCGQIGYRLDKIKIMSLIPGRGRKYIFYLKGPYRLCSAPSIITCPEGSFPTVKAARA